MAFGGLVVGGVGADGEGEENEDAKGAEERMERHSKLVMGTQDQLDGNRGCVTKG